MHKESCAFFMGKDEILKTYCFLRVNFSLGYCSQIFYRYLYKLNGLDKKPSNPPNLKALMAVTIEKYKKAVDSLKKALHAEKNDISRDAAIQRFEFCVELAWKYAKKLMGTPTTAPKQIVREMAQNHFIQDAKLWLEAIEKRNLSSHTYNEDLAEEVYSFASRFLSELENLSTQFDSV